jgi:hypothetical protein
LKSDRPGKWDNIVGSDTVGARSLPFRFDPPSFAQDLHPIPPHRTTAARGGAFFRYSNQLGRDLRFNKSQAFGKIEDHPTIPTIQF